MRGPRVAGKLSRNWTPQKAKLDYIINQMVAEAKRTGGPVERHLDEDIALTYGQVKYLKQHNCRLYLRDVVGVYYYKANGPGKIYKEYV